MTFEEARDAVLAVLRQQGKAKNSEMLALTGADSALLERVREDLLFAELAEDVRGAGLRFTAPAPAPSSAGAPQSGPTRLFLSYGRHDAAALAERLEKDLKARGFHVWRDTREIKAGTDFQEEIADGLRSAQIVVALMTPHSTRTTRDASSPDHVDSVCLGELAHALFHQPPRPVVPIMARSCEPPLAIFHLDYVDMRRWEESEDQYRAGLERLIEGVAAAQRGEKRYRSWHHLLDPFDFAAFLHAKREGFTGRKWLFDAIDVWRQSSPRERALLIKGDPGAGKSALVAELVHLNPGNQVLAYHCCQWDTAQTLEPWRFVRSIAAMIAGKLEDYAALFADPAMRDLFGEASCRADPVSAFERGVLTPLQRLHAPEGGPRYLLVDALDEALLVPPGQPDIVSMLASRLDRLPPWLRLVATTRKEPAVLESLAGLAATEIEADLPENLADLRAYIGARLNSAALAEQVREGKQSAAALIEQLVEKSGGNFLYVRQALDGIAAGLHSIAALHSLPPGLRGLYAGRFAHLFPDDSAFAPGGAVLTAICAAREPLDRDLLARSSGLDPDRELPRALVHLAAYVPKRAASNGQPTYAVFHKSLADWLTDPERAGQRHQVSLREGNRALADACWNAYKTGVDAMPRYALTHLIAHLLIVGRWEEVEVALFDLAFLEARVRAGQASSLVEDFAAAVETFPAGRFNRARLRLLNEALLRDLQFIARHGEDYPQALFQCLWNSAWWHDCREAAPHYAVPNGEGKHTLPWDEPDPELKLCTVLERWRKERETRDPGFPWLRSLRPPLSPLGAGQLAVFRLHEVSIESAAFSPDGRRVLCVSCVSTCTVLNVVKLWDGHSGSELALFRRYVLLGKAGFSHAGHPVFIGCEGMTVQPPELPPPEDGMWEPWWISGGGETARLWDVQSGRELAVFRGHSRRLTDVAFSFDGRLILTGSEDHTARLWDLQSGRELAVFRGHEEPVTEVAFSNDGSRVFVGWCDRTVRVWDTHSGRELAVLRGRVAFSPNGGRALNMSDKTARLWDVESGRELAVLRHDEPFACMAFSPDGARLVSGSRDHTVRVWDTESGRELAVLRGHESPVATVAFSHDGARILSGSTDGAVRIWDSLNGHELTVLRGHTRTVKSVAFSPESKRVLSSSEDGTVRLWEAQGNKESARPRPKGREEGVFCVEFSPDGQRFLIGSKDKTPVRLWDVQGGRELAALKGHEGGVGCAAFSPDGQRALTGSCDKTLRLWDLQSGRELAVFGGHEGSVGRVAFSSDGLRALSASDDRTVRVWDTQTGRELAILRGHEGSIDCAIFSRDDQCVLSGSGDGTARLWEAQSGRELTVFRRVLHWVECGDVVTGVAFSSNGRRVLSRTRDKTVRVWDAQSGECLAINGNVSDTWPVDFRLHVYVVDGETIIESGVDMPPLAWLPDSADYYLRRWCGTVEGPTWGGMVDGRLFLLRLEGANSAQNAIAGGE